MDPGKRSKQRIVIAGAGPAGSSLGIRLARAGWMVTIVERETFPRAKLCGEFISPECLEHFDELGVRGLIDSPAANRILETRFYDVRGRSFGVPSSWLGSGEAVGLSRSAMDMHLLGKAEAAGAEVIQSVQATRIEYEAGRAAALTLKTEKNGERTIVGNIFVDATGRSAVMQKLIQRELPARKSAPRPSVVGFKAHMSKTLIEPGRCEIYSFPHGYGGLVQVENGSANFCFLLSAEAARRSGGADAAVKAYVRDNARAREMMPDLETDGDWLAVAISRFGSAEPVLGENIFAVGDSAGFIDPFTGSGILMALECSRLFADCLDGQGNFAARYTAGYRRRFRKRLMISSIFRRASFSPRLAGFAIAALASSVTVRRLAALSTRARSPWPK